MAAKLYKDLSPAEKEARDAELGDFFGGIIKEEIFGIPGLFGDLAEPAAALMNPVLYGLSPEIRENVSEFHEIF